MSRVMGYDSENLDAIACRWTQVIAMKRLMGVGCETWRQVLTFDIVDPLKWLVGHVGKLKLAKCARPLDPI